MQPDHPLVLKGGPVLDGTGAPGYRAHVAIFGGLGRSTEAQPGRTVRATAAEEPW